MINIDFLTLKAFLIENIDFFIGARLQKIQQPSRRELILSLRNNFESRRFYINISPQIYHLCFMNKNNEIRRNIIIPKQPPMFCMLLRKYLEGAKISDALTVTKERILELHFEIYDELSERRSLALCIELMGKHSNIILYDRISSIIIGCMHNVGSEKSRYRELQGGLKYIRPPKKNGGLPLELQKQFSELNYDQINAYLNKEIYIPAILNDRYTLFKELLPESIVQNSINEMLDNYYSEFQFQTLIKEKKNQYLSIAEGKLNKVLKSIKKIEALLVKRDNTEKYRLYGELLTANIYQKKDYSKQIEVFDYINNENVTIELDETKTLKENAQRYFKLYTKSKVTKEKSQGILNNLKMEKEKVENIIYSINLSDKFDELEEVSSELGFSPVNKEKIPVNNIIHCDINGFKVYVGKNNKQNDYIVSKLAKDEDYWFHTKLCAGSHVLLKTNNMEPDEKVIYECCKLARQYSSALQPAKVGVIYTKRKFLKKPPGSPLGYVTYRNEKEILI